MAQIVLERGVYCSHIVHNEECIAKYILSYFSTKTYVVGTQKNRLNETVLLSTENICSD